MTEHVQVTINELGAQGDGIAIHEGVSVYVPLTLPGEVVSIALGGKQGEGRSGKLLDIIEASDARVEPPCRHFQQCGGCSLQHLEAPSYLEFKAEKVRRALGQRGLDDISIQPPLAFPAHSRRRVTMSAQKIKKKIVLGFHQSRGNQIVDITECTVVVPEIEAMLAPIKDLLGDIMPGGGKGTVSMTATDVGVDLLLDVGLPLDLPLREALATFALKVDVARLTWRWKDTEEPVIVLRAPVVTSHGIKVALPTSVFLQASTQSEASLISYVLREIGSATRVADLFSGCGTFSFPLASQARVDAFDIDIDMVEAARKALPSGHDAPQLVTRRRDLFREPITEAELDSYDAVVLDPPRAGAKAQCQELAKSEVDDVIMVSCNPATFARDARILVDGGYTLDSVQPVDQFLWSSHIELVGSFYR